MLRGVNRQSVTVSGDAIPGNQAARRTFYGHVWSTHSRLFRHLRRSRPRVIPFARSSWSLRESTRQTSARERTLRPGMWSNFCEMYERVCTGRVLYAGITRPPRQTCVETR